MKKQTKQLIVDFIKHNGPQGAKAITDHFGLYKTIIHRHLKELIEDGKLIKLGKAPKVIYRYNESNDMISEITDQELSYQVQTRINNNYLSFDSDGTILRGYTGFTTRCHDRNFNLFSQYQQYRQLRDAVEAERNTVGLIDNLESLVKKGGSVYLDSLYVADTYTLGQFGKSSLGSLAFYGKQTQNKKLITQVIETISMRFKELIQEKEIDAICFAPTSIKRQVQIMDLMKQKLHNNKPIIFLDKYFPGEIVAQKTLKGDLARNKNANNTIFPRSGQKGYTKVLLADDFIGSGATLNISAKKLKESGLATIVIGFAIVGNMDLSYEFVSEV